MPPPEPEDDKISLPFVVTDLRGRSLWPLRERAVAQVGMGGHLGGGPEGRGGGTTLCVCVCVCSPKSDSIHPKISPKTAQI